MENLLNKRLDFIKVRYKIHTLPHIIYPYRSTYISLGENNVEVFIESITGNSVDNTDIKNPVINSKVPLGGTTGQVLTKTGNNDFDIDWVNSQGGTGSIDSITGNIVDNTDPANPIINASQVGISNNYNDLDNKPSLNFIESVTGTAVDLTDPINPIINNPTTPNLQQVTNQGQSTTNPISHADGVNPDDSATLGQLDNKLQNYLTTEQSSLMFYPLSSNPSGYINSFTENDPIFTAWLNSNPFGGLATEQWVILNHYTKSQSDDKYYPRLSNPENYLTSFTETDPVFQSWLATNPFNGYALESWINNDFYSKTEINNYFSGNSNISGYNKVDWDETKEKVDSIQETFDLFLTWEYSGNKVFNLPPEFYLVRVNSITLYGVNLSPDLIAYVEDAENMTITLGEGYNPKVGDKLFINAKFINI